MEVIQIIGGLVMLFLGGESLVKGSIILARIFGLSTLVIGLTIIAYGTSMPEMMVSVQATLDGHYDIAVGNIIGSNISNIILVLAAAAIIYPITIDTKIARREGILLVALTAIFIATSYFYHINPTISSLYLMILFGYSFAIYRTAKFDKETLSSIESEVEEETSGNDNKIGIPAPILILAGFTLLFYGADMLVEGASNLAKKYGISEATISVTIVAFGSSAPEFFTAIVSAYRRHSELVVGNIMGSCIFNIAGVLGVSGFINNFSVSEKFLTFDMWWLAAITLIFFLSIFFMKTLPRLWGTLLIISYITYIYMQF